MDAILIGLGFLLMIAGMVGSFLPIPPGPFTSWLGLLVLHLTEKLEMNWWLLIPTLIIAILVWVLDYFIPALGAKKYGGTKSGMIGTTVGLIIGLIFLGPFGIIIGPFLGALLGELVSNPKDINRAIKAAFGSFVGFITSTMIKFGITFIYLFIYVGVWYANFVKS